MSQPDLSLHWLQLVKNRIVFEILLLVYNVVHNIAPQVYLVSLVAEHPQSEPFAPHRELCYSVSPIL